MNFPLPLDVGTRGKRTRYEAIVIWTGTTGAPPCCSPAVDSAPVLEKNDRVGGILAGY